MSGKETAPNPLLATGKLDTSLGVQLHPLVLLTISDYITRHTLRQHQGPVVGAIIGQQNGRSYTLEHAFECKTVTDNDEVKLDSEWFAERVEQYKEVHKDRGLELVGLFTLGPVEGPQTAHLPVLQQVGELTGSDNTLLLLFHPELVDQLQGGKLPISLYESFQEPLGEQMQMRFKEVTFEVETSEAEMISVDFVAKGGGNATAIPGGQQGGTNVESSMKESSSKDKAKNAEDVETNGTASSVLSAEDEELIASLTAKANAIRMLNQRINLIRSYLTSLPPSYLNDATSLTPPPDTTNHTLLRSVSSLLSRLPLLQPPTAQADSTQPRTEPATSKQSTDVHLTSLLASLTRSISEAQNMGSRFHIVQREKASKDRNTYGGGGGGGRAHGGRMPGFADEEQRGSVLAEGPLGF